MARRALRPDSRKCRDRRKRRVVHVERVLDRGEDLCPWLTTRTSTNRLIPVRYGNPTRIGYVPICLPYVTWPSCSSRNTSRRTIPSGTTRRSISWSIVVRTASLNRRNSWYSRVGSNSPPNGPHLADVDPTNPEVFVKRRFKNARFSSNVFFVSPSRPATKFSRAEGSACHSRRAPSPHRSPCESPRGSRPRRC